MSAGIPTNFLHGSSFDRMAEFIHLSRCCRAPRLFVSPEQLEGFLQVPSTHQRRVPSHQRGKPFLPLFRSQGFFNSSQRVALKVVRCLEVSWRHDSRRAASRAWCRCWTMWNRSNRICAFMACSPPAWRSVPTCPCTRHAAFGSAAYPSLQIVSHCKVDLAFCVGLLHRMPIAWDGGRARCGSPYATARFTVVATLLQFFPYSRAPPPTQLLSQYSHGIGERPSYPRPRLCPGEVFHPPPQRGHSTRCGR